MNYSILMESNSTCCIANFNMAIVDKSPTFKELKNVPNVTCFSRYWLERLMPRIFSLFSLFVWSNYVASHKDASTIPFTLSVIYPLKLSIMTNPGQSGLLMWLRLPST